MHLLADGDASTGGGGLLGLVPKPAKHVGAWEYFYANQERFVAAMAQAVEAAGLTPPLEGMRWVGSMVASVTAGMNAVLDEGWTKYGLEGLLYPANPEYMIDMYRPRSEGSAGESVDGKVPLGPPTWAPLAGQALGVEAVARVRESLARLGPRYLEETRTGRDGVQAESLVTSHFMDRVVARLICDPAVTSYRGKRLDQRTPQAPLVMMPPDSVEWLGATDRKLWNWVKVQSSTVDPASITREGLAAFLFEQNEQGDFNTHYAAYITGDAPFFRLPPEYARRWPEARQHEPPEAVDDARVGPGGVNALDLADSALATEAAFAQAKDEMKVDRRGIPLAPDVEEMRGLLARSERQLERAAAQLGPWGINWMVGPASRWAAQQQEWLAATPDRTLIKLRPVLDGQQSVLFEATGAVLELDEMARGAGVQPGAPEAAPFTEVLKLYAGAMGQSHLIDSAREQMERARKAKAVLPLDLVDRSLRESHDAMRGVPEGERGGGTSIEHLQAQHQGMLTAQLGMRSDLAAGKELDAGSVQGVVMTTRENAFRARLEGLQRNLGALQKELWAANDDTLEQMAAVYTFHDNIRELPLKIGRIEHELWEQVQSPMEKETLAAYGPEFAAVPDERKFEESNRLRGEILDRAERRMAAIIERHDIDKLHHEAIDTIASARIRQLVLQLVLLIGVSVAGGLAGSVVSGAVRGALLADAASGTVGLLRGARMAQMAGTVAGITTDAAVNAAGQVVIGGDSAGDALIENLATNAAVLVALKPLQDVAASWGALDHGVADLDVWQKARRGGKLMLRGGVTVGGEMITAAGVSYMVQRALDGGKPPDEQTAAQWALQGASMAVGRFISGRLSGLEARLGKMAEQSAHLRTRARKLEKRAIELEKTGDQDLAMELLVEDRKLYEDEARLLDELARKPPDGIAASTIDTLRAGNRTAMEGTRGLAYDTMPLRLHGLEPDDASGKTWVGASEDIAVALHQAERAGLDVTVHEHDTAARRWDVSLGGQRITILEQKLHGRPRAPRAEHSDDAAAKARRYAEAAEFMQVQWEARVKAEIESREVVEIDHLQIGHALAGVTNQATLPGAGTGERLVVYQHRGSLAGRGDQELGQEPGAFDTAGVRGSEQAAPDSRWITSEQHGRSLDVGRMEVQTPAYQGAVVAIEKRPRDATAENWKALDRPFRARVRAADGSERWFYATRLDNAGGMGTSDLSTVRKVVDGGDGVPADRLASMMERGLIIAGDDPEYAKKVKPGSRHVLVWGGSPTGAWAAEFSQAHGAADVTVVGDLRTPADWPGIFRAYSDVSSQLDALPADGADAEAARAVLRERRDALEEKIKIAHKGSTLPRNRKRGAGFNNPDIHVEFGTPSRIEELPDGRLAVTIGAGDVARTSVFDQVVTAHGQDPGAAGGPGALLGEGARLDANLRPIGAVPEGTIALVPTYSQRRDANGDVVRGEDGAPVQDLVGLESVDPPGLRLVGAAFAAPKMARWVRESDRAAFLDKVGEMAVEGALTRDHTPISSDSDGVSTGVEAQRDAIPRANEAVAAGVVRLPGPDRTLDLDPAHPDTWDAEVRTFLAASMRADDRWVRVQRLGGGMTQAIVYRVWVAEHEVGVLKLFNRAGDAESEQSMLRLLEEAKLSKMKAVRERGVSPVDEDSGYRGALLMDAAPGTSIKDMIAALPDDAAVRADEMSKLRAAVQRTAEGLAQMHDRFASGEMMAAEAKADDANHFLERNFQGGADTNKIKFALGDDFGRIKAALEGPALAAFMAAEVPATAYHGDANVGNFLVDSYDATRKTYKDLGVIDVGSMKWSVPPGEKKGTKTGAADMARFLGSLESMFPGKLTPAEIDDLSTRFRTKYYEGVRVERASFERVASWYRVEMEIAALKSGDQSARARILRELALGETQ